MKFFSQHETRAVVLILALIALVSFPNFLTSLRRARDAQRKADLSAIYNSLLRYQADFGSFPLSQEGKITACKPVTKRGKIYVFSICEWGKDALVNLTGPTYSTYIELLPSDPSYEQGVSYYYLSNGSRFQIYGALEGKDEAEYTPAIVGRNLPCGSKTCNFGRSSGQTPLDKSIEEYENEIRQ